MLRMFRSVYGSMLPVVRMVVTPAARYMRGALKASSVTKKPGGGILSSSSMVDRRRVHQVVVHADQAWHHAAAGPASITWAPAGGALAASVIGFDAAVAQDDGAVFLRRRAGAVDDAAPRSARSAAGRT